MHPEQAVPRHLDRGQLHTLIGQFNSNADVFARLKYLNADALRRDRESHSVITKDDNEIIAAASVQVSVSHAMALIRFYNKT